MEEVNTTQAEASPPPESPQTSAKVKKRNARIFIIELRASLASFSSILPPVFFTMLLSAIVVLYVTPDASESFGQSPIVLFNEDSADSNSQAAGIGLVNALVIIGVITIMTFLIVCLLYFHCEKVFAVYLFFALVMLMGFTTGTMVVEGLRNYQVPTDIITLAIFFYNYAIVGAIAIFSYETGFQGKERQIPYFITQVYLVLVSVVMAWLVTSIFPDFTVWALLVCLALYDLCAVLTPCGPLKLLIQVVTARQEADAQKMKDKGEDHEVNNQKQMIPGLLFEVRTGKSQGMKKFEQRRQEASEKEQVQQQPKRVSHSADARAAGALNFSVLGATSEPDANQVEELEEQVLEDQTNTVQNDEEIARALAEADNEAARLRKIEELQEKRKELEEKLYQELLDEANLKLGLGDFVFYSVLTAKSAEFGFIAFISVACCVLCGLCGTLILLSVFQQALPALPISIVLGVLTYVIVFQFVSPFTDGLALNLATV